MDEEQRPSTIMSLPRALCAELRVKSQRILLVLHWNYLPWYFLDLYYPPSCTSSGLILQHSLSFISISSFIKEKLRLWEMLTDRHSDRVIHIYPLPPHFVCRGWMGVKSHTKTNECPRKSVFNSTVILLLILFTWFFPHTNLISNRLDRTTSCQCLQCQVVIARIGKTVARHCKEIRSWLFKTLWMYSQTKHFLSLIVVT